MYLITKITPTKKFGFNNIYLDGQYSFTVCDLVLATFKLKEKEALDETKIEQILSLELTERFKSYSLNILASRPRSEREITKKLDERTKKYKETWPVFSSPFRHSERSEESPIINTDKPVREYSNKVRNSGSRILNLKEMIENPQRSSTDLQNPLLPSQRNICFEAKNADSIFQRAKENTLEFLKNYNYLNNEDFAKWLLDQRLNQGKGKLYIKQDLFKKGVPKEIIEETLKNTNFESSIKPVYQKALKKYSNEKDPYKRKQKIYRYLMSRGFNYDEIKNEMNLD